MPATWSIIVEAGSRGSAHLLGRGGRRAVADDALAERDGAGVATDEIGDDGNDRRSGGGGAADSTGMGTELLREGAGFRGDALRERHAQSAAVSCTAGLPPGTRRLKTSAKRRLHWRRRWVFESILG